MTYSPIFKHHALKLLALIVMAVIAATWPGQAAQPAQAQEETALLFIENVGQFPDGRTRFQANLGQMTLHLADEALWLTVVEAPARESQAASSQGVNLKLSFANANPAPRLEPFNPIELPLSYFGGRDPAAWQTNVPVWGGVRYVELYPGLDLEITAEAGQVVTRLVVREAALMESGSSLQDVSLQVEGAAEIAVNEAGQLRLTTTIGQFTWPLLQLVGADDQPLALPAAPKQVGEFEIAAPFAPAVKRAGSSLPAEVVAAEAADLLYSTFLGGSSGGEEGRAIAVDQAGNAYVVGNTISADFPVTPGAFDTSLDSGDAFVAKLNPTGTALIYATFISGGRGFAIAVDEAGSAYIGGDTASADFPVTPGAADPDYNDGGDAFVLKLSPDGTALAYATYLGGSGTELGFGLAVDELGQAYATGFTASADFPATPGAVDPDYNGGGPFGHDAFVAKLNPAGTALVYATYLGGSNSDEGYAIAVDEAGNTYLAGQTESTDFPVTPGAFDLTFRRSFVAKLNPSGAELVYATYLGGNGADLAWAIAVDQAGQAYVAGDAVSTNFPTTPGAFQTTAHGSDDITHLGDAFVVKFNSAGSALIYGTYVGGSDHDNGFGLAIDEANQAYLTGSTYSSDFPTTPGAFQTRLDGYPDAFVAKLNASGSGLAYGTYLGGQFGEAAYTIVAGGETGQVYLTGYTSSPDFPVSEPAFSTERAGGQDAFVTRLATGSSEPEPPPPLPAQTCAPTPLGQVSVGDNPRGVAVDPERSRVYVANYGSNSVSIIDGATNNLLRTISGLTTANGLAYDPTQELIWVSNYELDSLTPIQTAANPADYVALPAIGVGNGPWGVAYDPIHNYVYVANSLGNSVSLIDAASRSLVTTLNGSFNQPFHLAANPVTGKVYVANAGHNSVTVINGAAVSKVVQLWDSGRAYGIAVDETREVIYVATVQTNRIVALGPLKGQPDQFLGWASFQRGYNPNRRVPLRAIAVNPQIGPVFDGGHLWATTSSGDGSEANQALFIPKGWSSRFHVPFAHTVGANPTEGIAIDRTANRVYVTSSGSPGQVTVLGDHATVCGGIAPAEASPASGGITFELYSAEAVTLSDVNGDGQVDILDLSLVAAHYGSAEATADLNGDGVVDILDLTLVAGAYGQKLPGFGE
jgi:YVTN family beta-propeller protein